MVDEVDEAVAMEVGDADSADPAIGIEVLHGPPRPRQDKVAALRLLLRRLSDVVFTALRADQAIAASGLRQRPMLRAA